MLKRAFDVAVSLAGLVVLSPVLLLTALAVRLDSRGPVLFRQTRVGKDFQPFKILKFRSMRHQPEQLGPQVTSSGDQRVTRVGSLLRKTKLDELPQLFNVLKGDMSLVGPRPEVPKYVEMFHDDFAEVLTVRPGITDIASIEFRDEATVLGKAPDPELEYTRCVLPRKLKLAKEYVRQSSLRLDLQLILGTLVCVIAPGSVESSRFGSAVSPKP